jgi:hypothetical protein
MEEAEQSSDLGKETGHSVRLFGTNNIKDGAM